MFLEEMLCVDGWLCMCVTAEAVGIYWELLIFPLSIKNTFCILRVLCSFPPILCWSIVPIT